MLLSNVMAGLVPATHVFQSAEMKGGSVSIVTNKPNGVLYIGVTSDLAGRIYEHREGLLPGSHIPMFEETRLARRV